jgi:endonuclease/exonuclease/phosphatase family metal-dependent hydrolase
MRFVSYNIQYGTGKDGRVDLPRIAAELGPGPDVIALQEVERYFSASGMTDQAAEIAALLPEHHWVYGPGVDLDASLRGGDGKVVHRRRQFGNMLLSKTPILSSRNHLLPKRDLGQVLSLQRTALECVIATPDGPVRVYCLHLAHASADERLLQIARLLELLREAPEAGGVWSGDADGLKWSLDASPPPMPRPAVILGDFNLVPDSAEYGLLTGAEAGLSDAWLTAGNDPAAGATCNEDKGPVRIDYGFLTPELAGRVRGMRVDRDARGSDHQPIHLEFEF